MIDDTKDDILDKPVRALRLKGRARHLEWDFPLIRDLVAETPEYLMRTPGVGRVSLQAARIALARHGLSLRDDYEAAVWLDQPPPEAKTTVAARLASIEAKLDMILDRLSPAS